ncbi:MAG: endonuclease III [Anaerolineaceae bacterium]|nr:endonuclease III [Anaerolineaceae bacterium]
MAEKKNITETIPDFAARQAKYAPVAVLLRERYGYPAWRQHLLPLDELVNCILSQSTSDTNRDKGYDALLVRYPTWEVVRDADPEEVIETIRPAGLANQKGPRIQEVLNTITEQRGELSIDFLNDLPLDDARDWLMSLNGVGPKTAAIVLCFAFNRPAFPVDTHIHRVSQRIGFLPPKTNAEKAHPIMEAIVPPGDYYAFHLNVIEHGRKVCRARQPNCDACPLTAYCDYYKNDRENGS